jgi:hypothetical protein
MVHPSLNDVRSALPYYLNQSTVLRRTRQVPRKINGEDRNAGIAEFVSERPMPGQGYDPVLDDLTVKPGNEAGKHGFGAAALQSVDDMSDPYCAHGHGHQFIF